MMDAAFSAVARLWEQNYSQREIAYRLKMSEPKVRKILITIGAIETDESRLYAGGMSPEEIAAKLGKTVKAVSGRLPYTKGQYGAEYPTINAIKIRKARTAKTWDGTITDRQFYAAYQVACNYDDQNAFAADLARSPEFRGAEGDDAAVLATELRRIWRYAHITVQEIIDHTGLTQTDFSARYVIPIRTLQGWISGSCSCQPYVRLMLSKLSGL